MTLDILKKHRLIGILRRIPPEYALGTAQAMYEGGIRIFEVTFDPGREGTAEETGDVIRRLSDHFGDKACVGAGTVLTTDHVRAARRAGARFIVSPNTDERVVACTKENGMLSIPGAYTPTEIVHAYDLGADMVKVFPILPDGAAYLKNVFSPLSHIPFIATGGVTPDTIASFFAAGAAAVAAGASIVTRELAEKEDLHTIRENARRLTERIIRIDH